MLEQLNDIDWQRYRRGSNPRDIPGLLRSLASGDEYTRNNACNELNYELDEAYKIGSDLPIVLIPFLFELLAHPQLPDKLVITDLLIGLVSYDARANLPEPYKSRAAQYKAAVCARKDIFTSLTHLIISLKEDIQELLKACGNDNSAS